MAFGRIRKEPAEDYVEYIIAPRLEEYKSQFQAQMLIHRAHLIMLFEQGIIKKDEADKILKGLSSLEKEGLQGLELEPQSDLYMATEKGLIEKIGEVGGKIHIGRSRNDLSAASTRMYVRGIIIEIVENLVEFIKVLLKLSEENIGTVMSGYTHWQHAQPVTLAHYLIGHADSAIRSLDRLYNAYKTTNQNPLGATALAGTGFPIDRLRTTELLGFNGLLENSYDAVASRDFIAETAAAVAILMCDLSRLTEDLIIFTTLEFSIIELSDEYSGTSSIMPQKKNPISLEMIRAKSGHVIGDLTAILSMLKSIPYSNVADWSEICAAFSDAVYLAIGALKVIRGLLSTLYINKELLIKRASNDFSTMTELVDVIVRERGLSFRVAHEVVSNVVIKAINEKKTPAEINTEIIDEAAIEIIGKPLELSREVIKNSLDPMENVKRRSSRGGPAPIEVRRMLTDRLNITRLEEAKLNNIRKRIEQTKMKLIEAEKKILT